MMKVSPTFAEEDKCSSFDNSSNYRQEAPPLVEENKPQSESSQLPRHPPDASGPLGAAPLPSDRVVPVSPTANPLAVPLAEIADVVVPFVTAFYSSEGVVVRYAVHTTLRDGHTRWCVDRRYRELCELFEKLKELYMKDWSIGTKVSMMMNSSTAPLPFPKFPSKSILANQNIKSLIARRYQLNRFFRELLHPDRQFVRSVQTQKELVMTLSPKKETQNAPEYICRDAGGFVELVEKTYVLAYFLAPAKMQVCKNADWLSLAQGKTKSEDVEMHGGTGSGMDDHVRQTSIANDTGFGRGFAVASIPTLAIGLPYAKLCFDAQDVMKLMVVLRCDKNEPRHEVIQRFNELVAFYQFSAASGCDSLPDANEARRFFYRFRKEHPVRITNVIPSGSLFRRDGLPRRQDGTIEEPLVALYLSQLRKNGQTKEPGNHLSANSIPGAPTSRRSCTNSKHFFHSLDENESLPSTVCSSDEDIAGGSKRVPMTRRTEDGFTVVDQCACTDNIFCSHLVATAVSRYDTACGKQILVHPPLDVPISKVI